MTLPHVERSSLVSAEEQNALIDQVNQNTVDIASGGPGGGVSDHGLLSGLLDDDHPQYHNDVRGDVRYSAVTHAHDSDYSQVGHTHDSRYYTESEVNTSLAAKSDVGHTHAYAPVAHTHDVGDIDALGTPDSTNFLRGDGTWAVPSGSGGTNDHGSLMGLADDDHLQYHTDARGDARYSQLGHAHAEYLTQTEGDAAYAALSHLHDDRYYTETEVDTALTGKAASVHSHAIGDVTSLQTSLDGKSPTTHNHDSSYSDIAHNHDVDYSPASHTHAYDPVGTAAAEVAAHEADPSPHYRATTATLNGTAATVDATQFNAVNITLNGAGTLNVPTGGADGSVVQVVAYAAAQQTLTFHASYARLDGINASYVVPAGKKLRALVRRSTVGTDVWVVEAAGVTQ